MTRTGEIDTRTGDPLQHIRRTAAGVFVWLCEHDECNGKAHGNCATESEARIALRLHAITDCPATIRATDRLFADVMAIPRFRPASFLPYTEAAFCVRCQYLVLTLEARNAHIDAHLAAVAR